MVPPNNGKNVEFFPLEFSEVVTNSYTALETRTLICFTNYSPYTDSKGFVFLAIPCWSRSWMTSIMSWLWSLLIRLQTFLHLSHCVARCFLHTYQRALTTFVSTFFWNLCMIWTWHSLAVPRVVCHSGFATCLYIISLFVIDNAEPLSNSQNNFLY